MPTLIERLREALSAEEVSYCHWKSNAFLDLAARGEDDLDLLVDPAGRPAFLEVLDRLGFKEAAVAKGKPVIPGILDYYGHDESAPGFVHVHAHYKLILGHDLTKNYHLPVESALVASSSPTASFPIPAQEFEYAIFVVRMALKHTGWHALLGRRGRLSDREQRELELFRTGIPVDRVHRVLSEHLPFLAAELFDRGVRSLEEGSSVLFRFRTGRMFQKALRGCRVRPKGLDSWLHVRRRVCLAIKRRLRRPVSRKRLKNGGLLVAFVGGDGAGKTTVIEGVSAWFSSRFATEIFHMGKPLWSFRTFLVRGALKIGRLMGFWPYSRVPLDVRDESNPIPFPGYPALIRAVCTARDRFRTYVRARRLADQGRLVVCDRFPLPGHIHMDGPQIEWMTRTSSSKSQGLRLRRIEEAYYRSIGRPDVLIVLRLDPETAIERKTDENPASVRVRSTEIWRKDWSGLGALKVDAAQTREDVLREIKNLLWARL
jgi:thymidylate kinase